MTTPQGLTSLAFGALFGAILTIGVYWSYKGYLNLPQISARAYQPAILGAMIGFFADGLLVALLALVGILFATALITQPEVRRFFSLKTLQKLTTRDALRWAGYGVGVGAVGGAVSSQILMIPMKHCTYESGTSARDYLIGLTVTLVSSTFLLFPIWTWVGQGGRFTPADRSTSGFFRNNFISLLLLLPTLIILVVFLYYPGTQVITGSLERDSARIGQPARFVCLDNYTQLIESNRYAYENSFVVTAKITVAVVIFSLIVSLFIANLAYQKIRGANIYRTLLIWPYAISPVVVGAIFLVMFNPQVGLVNWILYEGFGTRPQWFSDPDLAPWVIIGSSVWNILGFNILFYIAGLQSVAEDLLEAASIDGANTLQRFFFIKFPLLSPYTFFLLVTNVTYAFYGIFGVVDRLTQGGPPTPGNSRAGATSVLIYNLYEVAFTGTRNQFGIANAQSLILFLLVAGITIFQFRVVERRVNYGG